MAGAGDIRHRATVATYSTLIAGPRREGEADGPEEFHVVLLDNGRSGLLANAEEREVPTCIRCGACLNICPVYKNLGEHTYNTTYPGPSAACLCRICAAANLSIFRMPLLCVARVPAFVR